MKNVIISKDKLIELCATSYEVGHRGYADQSNDFVENLVEDFLKEVDPPETSTRVKPNMSSDEITLWRGTVGNTDNSVLTYNNSISDQSIIVTANASYDAAAYTSTNTTQIEISEYDTSLNLTVDKNET